MCTVTPDLPTWNRDLLVSCVQLISFPFQFVCIMSLHSHQWSKFNYIFKVLDIFLCHSNLTAFCKSSLLWKIGPAHFIMLRFSIPSYLENTKSCKGWSHVFIYISLGHVFMCCFGVIVLVEEFAKLELTGIEYLSRSLDHGVVPAGSQSSVYSFHLGAVSWVGCCEAYFYSDQIRDCDAGRWAAVSFPPYR